MSISSFLHRPSEMQPTAPNSEVKKPGILDGLALVVKSVKDACCTAVSPDTQTPEPPYVPNTLARGIFAGIAREVRAVLLAAFTGAAAFSPLSTMADNTPIASGHLMSQNNGMVTPKEVTLEVTPASKNRTIGKKLMADVQTIAIENGNGGWTIVKRSLDGEFYDAKGAMSATNGMRVKILHKLSKPSFPSNIAAPLDAPVVSVCEPIIAVQEGAGRGIADIIATPSEAQLTKELALEALLERFPVGSSVLYKGKQYSVFGSEKAGEVILKNKNCTFSTPQLHEVQAMPDKAEQIAILIDAVLTQYPNPKDDNERHELTNRIRLIVKTVWEQAQQGEATNGDILDKILMALAITKQESDFRSGRINKTGKTPSWGEMQINIDALTAVMEYLKNLKIELPNEKDLHLNDLKSIEEYLGKLENNILIGLWYLEILGKIDWEKQIGKARYNKLLKSQFKGDKTALNKQLIFGAYNVGQGKMRQIVKENGRLLPDGYAGSVLKIMETYREYVADRNAQNYKVQNSSNTGITTKMTPILKEWRR